MVTSDDPIEHAVNSLPAYMQRRMAKLSLAGAQFIQEADGLYAWKVTGRNGGRVERYVYLAQAINEIWREWLMSQSTRDANTECFYDDLAREDGELPRR